MNFFKFFSSKPQKKLREKSLDEIKNLCKIVFIDDKSFPLINILKQSGWKNTLRLKDVDSLDQTEISEANILIVDIQGVGKKMKFSDEGLGLIIALKEKYPEKKVIVYSAEDQGKIQAFHIGIDKADKRLSKNSDPYQFQVAVENFSKEIFSLNYCIDRVKDIILRDFGKNYESEKIIESINKIYDKNDFSTEYISKIFNLQNASNLSSVIQLFLATQK